MTFSKHFKLLSIFSLLLFAAVTLTSSATAQQALTLHLELNNFAPLSNGFHYETWAIIGGRAIPAGKFIVDDTGTQALTLEGFTIQNNNFIFDIGLDRATNIVLTIEPTGDIDTTPAVTHYVAGPVVDGVASLDVASQSAFGNDFSSASGEFILATPTDDQSDNETSGVWFLNPQEGPGPGLNLPILPVGWTYEGWAVIDGTPVTTGKFLNPVNRDRAAPFSGQFNGPEFPGEDFLNNAPNGLDFPLDLGGSRIVLTIEPDPDDSPTPFRFIPLAQQLPQDVRDRVIFPLLNQSGGFPSAVAVIR